jgi:6-phospho-beta-glucosidase
VRVDGEDRLPELLERHGKEIADESGSPWSCSISSASSPPTTSVTTTRARPSWRSSARLPSRAEEVARIERELLELYRDPSLDRQPDLLRERGGAFYSEAAAQLVESLVTGAGDVQVVDVRNEGAIPDLPDDAVVEVPARIDRDGAHPVSLAPLAPELLGLVQQAKAYERLAARAAVDGDRDAALRALLANPLVGRFDLAERLLDALLDANREHLPRFFPG